jgi:hypothetical protein
MVLALSLDTAYDRGTRRQKSRLGLPTRTGGRVPQPLTGFEQTHPPSGATSLQPFIGLLLLLRRNHGLANVAAFPDPGSRDELGTAPAALFRHRLLQRENARFLGQQMRIMEIAVIHFRHLAFFGDHRVSAPGYPN